MSFFSDQIMFIKLEMCFMFCEKYFTKKRQKKTPKQTKNNAFPFYNIATPDLAVYKLICDDQLSRAKVSGI